MIDKYGDEEVAIDDTSEATKSYFERVKEGFSSTVTGSQKAIDAYKAVKDYVKGVHDSTKQAVNSVVKGFDDVGKAADGLREKQKEYGKEATDTEKKYSSIFAKYGGTDNDSLKKMAANWNKLSDKEKEAYNALVKIKNQQKEVNDALDQYKPEGMKKNLQDQIDFMNEYLENLEWAKQAGLSDELLASLSDGSKESAEYLAGLKEGGPEAAAAVDELYKTVQEKKKGFTDALTEQKLTVDETYDELVKKAEETVAKLNMAKDAQDSTGKTVQGIATGIENNLPVVQNAVAQLMAILSPMKKANVGFKFGFNPGIGTFNLDGSNEKGLNYVPFDGYLSELHEGEGILTAEENRVWQRFKNGDAASRNVDYETLGSLMRDNVHAGGNVYLDGRSVGQVISGIQGNQYRALQRSGWQQ